MTTHGFRGEALFALCTMSQKVTIVTKAKDFSSSLGHKIQISPKNEVHTIERIAKTTGTTITVDKLFFSYPVRRQEFEKNCKSQLNACLEVLYGFALLYSNVRFTCWNTALNG